MKVLIVYNPRSGQAVRRAGLEKAAARLRTAGWEVDLAAADTPIEIEAIARGAVSSGLERVLVVGGDGSLNAAAQALAGTRCALSVLPAGTANVWAREMGIPLELAGATEVFLNGEVAAMDLGTVDGRYFLLVASVGFASGNATRIDPTVKRRLGILAYLLEGLKEMLGVRGRGAELTVDGKTRRVRLLMLLVNNTRSYGGVVDIAPRAYADDGLLDIWVFRGRGRLQAIKHALRVILRLRDRGPHTHFTQARKVVVRSRHALPVQVDGDFLGTTPVTIGVAPRALRVVLPRGERPLFRGGPEG